MPRITTYFPTNDNIPRTQLAVIGFAISIDRESRRAPVPWLLTELGGRESISTCWFSGVSRGGKREHGGCTSIRLTSQQSVAAPATVSGEPASKRPLGNWEGRTKATTREPGDLPAQSPNRWAGRPHGACFRSGDIVPVCEGVRVRQSRRLRRVNERRRCGALRSRVLRDGLGQPAAHAVMGARTKEHARVDIITETPSRRGAAGRFAGRHNLFHAGRRPRLAHAAAARGQRHRNSHARAADRKLGQRRHRRRDRARSAPHHRGRAQYAAGAQRGADRQRRNADIGVHPRHQFQPRQGADRRHGRERSEHRQPHLRFRPSADLRHRAGGGAARTAERALRRRRHRRRDLDHHQKGRRPGEGDGACWKADRSKPSTRRRA